MARPADSNNKPIALNRRARFDFELGDVYEAGIALVGTEVRMLRDGGCNLTDAWCAVKGKQVFLEGVEIQPMPHAAFGHEPKRPRRLLLHAAEIQALARAVERDGMTIVPTRLYFKEGRVKVELAVAKGRKRYDKRSYEREKDDEREARAAMTRARRPS